MVADAAVTAAVGQPLAFRISSHFGSAAAIVQLPQTHFTKRISVMSTQAVPVRPNRKVSTPKRTLAPKFFSLIPTVIRRQTPKATAAPAAKSSHTHHSKSLGLKGIDLRPWAVLYPLLQPKE